MPDARRDSTEQPDRRHRLIILACCSLSLFIVGLDNTIVNVALPSIQRELGASVSGLQWVIDGYVLVLAALLLLSGSLGDRFGRRRMFRIGLVIFGLGSLLCSLAPNLSILVAFRMLQAIGASMLNPNTLSIISNVFRDPKERAQAIGVWGGVFGISAASGPILGGLLVDSVGWRSIFWVNLPVVAVAYLLATRFVPESKAAQARRLDPPGQILAITVLASLTYAIIEGPVRGWTSPLIMGLFGLAAASLVAFIIIEQRRAEPLLEIRFFRSPAFSGATSIAVLAFFVLAGFLFLNTLYLQEVRGDSALMAGLSTLPATIVIAVAAPVAGRLVARQGSRLPLTAAGLLLTAGALILAQVKVDSPYTMLALSYVLLGLGFGLVNPPITNAAVAGMPLAQAGVASAVASTSRQVGSVLGVAVIGSVVSSRFHRELLVRATALRLAPPIRQSLLNTGIDSTGLHLPAGTPNRHQLVTVVLNAFTAASHAGWYLAAGCGALVAIIALVTTGSRARLATEPITPGS
jgi:EmrB/QacA subfamily drug resistance transporter